VNAHFLASRREVHYCELDLKAKRSPGAT
jgi:hypothetical protein